MWCIAVCFLCVIVVYSGFSEDGVLAVKHVEISYVMYDF